MLIFPPEVPINLYQDDFTGNGLLKRENHGKLLSDLLARTSDPIVVAIDGPWGCGKTFFLRCWTGYHVKNFGEQSHILYFNAFENDYLDDPLISLTALISERLEADPKASRVWAGAKRVAARLARPVGRMAAAVATAGVSEITGPLVDAAADSVNREINQTIDAVWQLEAARRNAMRDFTATLSHITSDQLGSKALVIVVDELDRCRPDYALRLLETIKHFFNCKRVHFILGVNLDELSNMVSTRYGSKKNRNLYLEKFINVTMRLPETYDEELEQDLCINYFVNMSIKMKVYSKLSEYSKILLYGVSCNYDISMRAIQRILSQLALVPVRGSGLSDGYSVLIATIIISRVIDRTLYKKMRSGKIAYAEVHDFVLGGNERFVSNRIDLEKIIQSVWRPVISRHEGPGELTQHFFGRLPPTKQTLDSIFRNYIDPFKLPNPS